MMYGLKMMSHLLTNLSECVLGPLGIDRTGDTGGGGVHHQGGQTLYLSLHVQHRNNDIECHKNLPVATTSFLTLFVQITL